MTRSFTPISPKARGAGRNSAAVDAARDERLHIIGSLLAAQFSDHGFIARQLDIPAQQHIAEPHHRVEPVDRQQQEAQRLPQVVAPAQVRLLVGNDVLPVAAVHAIWEINSRTDRTEHERRINPLRLVDVSPQADRLAYPVPQPQRADHGIQEQCGSSREPDPGEDRKPALRRGSRAAGGCGRADLCRLRLRGDGCRTDGLCAWKQAQRAFDGKRENQPHSDDAPKQDVEPLGCSAQAETQKKHCKHKPACADAHVKDG